MPVNMPTHAHGQGYTDLNFLIPELVDRHRLPQGPVLRRGGRLLLGGLGAHRPVRHAAARHRVAHRRPGRLRARSGRELDRARRRARCSTRSSQRTTTARGTSRRSSTARTACCATLRRRRQPLLDHGDGLLGGLELDRPDPAARRRRRPDRPLRRARPDRRRPDRALQPVAADGAPLRRRRVPASTPMRSARGSTCSRNFTFFLEHPFDLGPTRSTATSSSRPSSAPCCGLATSRSWNMQARRPRHDQHARPAVAPRPPRPGRPLQHGRARSAHDVRRRATVRETQRRASTPRTRRSGRRGCAASPACAATASTSTWRARSRRTPASEATASPRPSSRSIFGPWAKTDTSSTTARASTATTRAARPTTVTPEGRATAGSSR